MANIIDYVRWRGDIPFAQVPLCAVDALVLSYLSYMPFDGLVSEVFSLDGARLSDAAEYFLEYGLSSSCMIDSEKEDCRLLEAIRDSERFGTLRLTGYVNLYDELNEEQFSAITFLLPDGPAFVAFRGTDSSVVGWKEDFNMSFESEVPSQGAALDYIVRAAAALPMRAVVGGHSKGGNLAVYAGVFAPQAVQDRIVCIYNFDGPGFNEQLIASPEFQQIDMRIHTFVPQSSLIGILLWHAEPFIVVKSDAVGLFQHNPYSWQVMGGSFVILPDRTRDSRLAEDTIKNWLSTLTPQERRRIIDGVYSVLSASDGRNLSDLFEGRNVRAILRAVSSLDEPTRDAIVDSFKRLGASLKDNLPDWFEDAAGQIRTIIAPRSAERIERFAEKLAEKSTDREENG